MLSELYFDPCSPYLLQTEPLSYLEQFRQPRNVLWSASPKSSSAGV